MIRGLAYTVETRTYGEPWRTSWRGPGKHVALEAAHALFADTWTPDGLSRAVPRYPYVRVRQGKALVLLLTPAERKEA